MDNYVGLVIWKSPDGTIIQKKPVKNNQAEQSINENPEVEIINNRNEINGLDQLGRNNQAFVNNK